MTYSNRVILTTVALAVAMVIMQVKADCCYDDNMYYCCGYGCDCDNTNDDNGEGDGVDDILGWWIYLVIALGLGLLIFIGVCVECWKCQRRYNRSLENDRRVRESTAVIVPPPNTSGYGTMGNPGANVASATSNTLEATGPLYSWQHYGYNQQQYLHVQSQIPPFTSQLPAVNVVQQQSQVNPGQQF
ncbi:uncharacterized protein LOC144353775 [Saccoglossus kowalevskii]